MAWIESHQELRNHPKIKRFARALQISIATAVGHMHFLWWWAVDYAPDGDLTDFADWEIAEAAGYLDDDENAAKFLNVLLEVGFLDRTDDERLLIHDWFEHAGKTVEQRLKAKERSKNNRDKAKNDNEIETNSERSENVRERSTNEQRTFAATGQDITGHNSTVHDSIGASADAEAECSETATPAPASNLESQKKPNSQTVVDLYHSICKSFPKVKVISESRKQAIRARFNRGYMLSDFQELFTKAENSAFLKGANDRNWMADFDWLIKDANMAKTLEGKYDNDHNARGRPSEGGKLNNAKAGSSDWGLDWIPRA